MGEIRTLSPGEVFGRRVREERLRQNLSQDELAARLTALGRPMDRSNVGRIESGRTIGQLDNLVAISLALGVAPVHLMVPREGEEEIALTPKRTLDAASAKAWTKGSHLLDDSDPLAFFAAMSDDEQVAIATRAGLGATNVPPIVVAAAGGWGQFTPSEQQMKKLRYAIADHFAAKGAARKASRRTGGTNA